MDSCSMLQGLLHSILLDRKDSVASCTVTQSGLKFSVDRARTLQARAYVKAKLFSDFTLRGQSLEFNLSLSALLQALQIFGGNSHLQIEYEGEGHPLRLTLEDRGVISHCEIRTLAASGQVDFNFRASQITNRVIVNSDLLRDAVGQFDPPGASSVEIITSTAMPRLSLVTTGDSCFRRVDFPESSNGGGTAVTFECKQNVSFRYNLNHFRPCVRELARFERTILRFNETGMLSMQHMVSTPGHENLSNWVEFVLYAEQELQANPL